jgi:hypothetical protein
MVICHHIDHWLSHAHTSPNNDYILLDVTLSVQNSQGPQNVGEVAFKWQEDWVYRK